MTRASSKSMPVKARRIKNQCLAAGGHIWVFASLTASSGATPHYDRRPAHGDRHISALRNLFNRMIGCLTTARPEPVLATAT
ncbi:MAG: hypothetical protein ACJ736_38895 [Streptomyces sp.]